ncbi:hypothetical protein [Methylobacterium sp. 17Sr1-1]|uniref:hypothetical protein n=1 Tax=Methylobacterium sp. 17Sr1-1 TaxID=2202826 RepID=UPI001FDFE962|nr:hypothetical protein [Methylobacterium sp. 17Sr1-1]
MRRGRNPRRAYDEEGREIAPPTVGSARAQGETTIAAHCHDCGHHAIVSTDRLPADLPIPDIALRLRCSACGSKRIGVMMDMAAHYARLTAETGWKMDPRPWPKAPSESRVEDNPLPPILPID